MHGARQRQRCCEHAHEAPSSNLQTTRRVRSRRANSSATAAQQHKGVLRVLLFAAVVAHVGDSPSALSAAESNQLQRRLEAPRNRLLR